MKFLVIIVFIGISITAKCQTSYKGGVGDGYSMASVTLNIVGISESLVRNLEVFPSILKVGGVLSIQTATDESTVVLMNMNGKKWALVGNINFKLPKFIQSGIYSVVLTDNDAIYVTKIAVIN